MCQFDQITTLSRPPGSLNWHIRTRISCFIIFYFFPFSSIHSYFNLFTLIRPAGYAKLARTKSPVNDANAQVPWSTSLITPYVDQDDPRTRFLSRPANFRALKWTRSPPLPSADKVPMGNLTAER